MAANHYEFPTDPYAVAKPLLGNSYYQPSANQTFTNFNLEEQFASRPSLCANRLKPSNQHNQPIVLVVDDETDNFKVVSLLLAKEPYQLESATSGEEALQKLLMIVPHVILLDVMMPGINGMETCRQIKQHPQWQHIPIIMVTALSSKSDLAQSIEAGADDFISKPVNGMELRSRVHSMMRIRQQYLALQQSMQLHDDMTHAIVHDLRNPITTAILACDNLLSMGLSHHPQQKLLHISDAMQRLRLMVDDILILAKGEAGELALQCIPINFNSVLRDTLNDFQIIANHKGIDLLLVLPERPIYCSLDVHLIRRALDNLIANALKFAPEHTTITITLKEVQLQQQLPDPEYVVMDCNYLEVSVADQGSGISSEKRNLIFERYQVGSPVSQPNGISSPQIGLGLFFCKLVVEAHGGTIAISDNQPRGTIFTLRIPHDLD
ncbi:MAG: hybrid sensor histidine kinase/response regulator [Pseudanabaena sp. ELA607]